MVAVLAGARMSKGSEMDFADRLNLALKAISPSTNKFALEHGFSESTIRGWLRRERDPKRKDIADLATALGVNLLWLVTGEGPMKPGEVVPFKRDDEILIPFFNIRAAAGDGLSAPDYEQPLPPISFKRAWLLALDVSSTTHLEFLFAKGKSMEPTIRDGDYLLIDRDPDGIKGLREGIWVIREDSEVKVKRLQRAGGIVRVISDDPTWPPYSVPTAEIGTTLIVLGRVIWSGKRH
jgi:phage repressor protein C with HTH and peptisase S24 domain